jgi:hypothetical protein
MVMMYCFWCKTIALEDGPRLGRPRSIWLITASEAPHNLWHYLVTKIFHVALSRQLFVGWSIGHTFDFGIWPDPLDPIPKSLEKNIISRVFKVQRCLKPQYTICTLQWIPHRCYLQGK